MKVKGRFAPICIAFGLMETFGALPLPPAVILSEAERSRRTPPMQGRNVSALPFSPAVILSGAGGKIAFSDLVEGDSPFKGKCREATKGLPPGYGPPMWGRNVAKKVGAVLAAARSPPCGEMTAARAVTTAMHQTSLKRKPPPLLVMGEVSAELTEGDSPFKGKCREATKGLPPGYGQTLPLSKG